MTVQENITQDTVSFGTFVTSTSCYCDVSNVAVTRIRRPES